MNDPIYERRFRIEDAMWDRDLTLAEATALVDEEARVENLLAHLYLECVKAGAHV